METLQKITKKAANKEAAKAKKAAKKAAAAGSTTVSALQTAITGSISEPDPLAANYGDIFIQSQGDGSNMRTFTTIKHITEKLQGKTVLFRGNVQHVKDLGKITFLTIRDEFKTVQCVVTVIAGYVSRQMVEFSSSISNESFVEVEGIVKFTEKPIIEATQKVEIEVRKIFCISRAAKVLPINFKDAVRSDAEIKKASEAGIQLGSVNQDTRLNNRVLDLRTPANKGIFYLECKMLNLFSHLLVKQGFLKIVTPKIIAGSSEGGAAVFNLDYNNKHACLAQSPQLHKQMAINAGFKRVFVEGPVFRAEDSYTHRHLCEFTGVDVEMEIMNHYIEVMDVVDRLFVELFDTVNETCQELLQEIAKQYPFTPLKYHRKTLRLKFEDGIKMLQASQKIKAAGIEVDPLGDLTTELERILGELVLEKYGTEFYILYGFPLAVRPFYTMPHPENAAYSNSFDVFIRGEEIISGGQRVHSPELLESRALQCGIDVNTISTYIDSFRYGGPPHGGFGVGVERVVMLFCGLDNIRKTSLFPRDPKRLEP